MGNINVGTCTQGPHYNKQLQRYSATSLHSIPTRCSGDGVTLVETAYKCRCINQYWRETRQSSPEQQWLHPDLLMWSHHSSIHMSRTLACHHEQWWCLSRMLPCVPASLSHIRASTATVSQESQSVSPPSGRHKTGGLQQRQATELLTRLEHHVFGNMQNSNSSQCKALSIDINMTTRTNTKRSPDKHIQNMQLVPAKHAETLGQGSCACAQHRHMPK